jgi:hypothetical protein
LDRVNFAKHDGMGTTPSCKECSFAPDCGRYCPYPGIAIGFLVLFDLDQCALPPICPASPSRRCDAAMAFAREVIMTMQSDHNGRGGLANNLTLQLSLLAAAVVLVLFLAAHYIW